MLGIFSQSNVHEKYWIYQKNIYEHHKIIGVMEDIHMTYGL